MHLIQIFLPLRDNAGRPIAQAHFDQLARELGDRFGGLTSYARAPATGLWKRSRNAPRQRDQIVIYEVMARRLDARWWKQLRRRLEKTFRQQQILVRSLVIRQL